MSNYFSNRTTNHSKKVELLKALQEINRQEHEEREEYLHELNRLISIKPGMTAIQYAAMLTNNEAERCSIATSLAMMGYMADACRSERLGYHTHKLICTEPSMPTLCRDVKKVKRRFLELDENNNPIASFEKIETKYIYSLND